MPFYVSSQPYCRATAMSQLCQRLVLVVKEIPGVYWIEIVMPVIRPQLFLDGDVGREYFG